MSSLAEQLTEDLLASLAGSAAFDRGVEYQRDGVVRDLSAGADSVSAVVQGTQAYQTRFWLEAQELKYSCTCPQFAKTARVCKHLVASGLACLDAANPPPMSTGPVRIPLVLRASLAERALYGNDVSDRLTNVRQLIDSITGQSDGRSDRTWLPREQTDTILDSLTDLMFRGHHEAVRDECEYFLDAIRRMQVKFYGTNTSSYLVQRLFTLHLAATVHCHVRSDRLADLLASWNASWPQDLGLFYSPVAGLSASELFEQTKQRRAARPTSAASTRTPAGAQNAALPSVPVFADVLRVELLDCSGGWIRVRMAAGGRDIAVHASHWLDPFPHVQEWLLAQTLAVVPVCEVSIDEEGGGRTVLRVEKRPPGLARFTVTELDDHGRRRECLLDVELPHCRLVQAFYQGIRGFAASSDYVPDQWQAISWRDCLDSVLGLGGKTGVEERLAQASSQELEALLRWVSCAARNNRAIANGPALFFSSDWAALHRADPELEDDLELDDFGDPENVGGADLATIFGWGDTDCLSEYNRLTVAERLSMVRQMLAGCWSAWDGRDLRRFGCADVERWLAGNALAPDLIEFRLKSTAGKRNDLGLPQVWAEVHLAGRAVNINTAGHDAIDYAGLVDSVERDGVHRIVRCWCGLDGCYADTAFEVAHAGDLIRLRVARSHAGGEETPHVVSRQQYADAVLAALRHAVAIQQTMPVPGTSGATPAERLTNVGTAELTEQQLLDNLQRIEEICARLAASA